MFSLWTRYPCASYHHRDSAAEVMALSITTGANRKERKSWKASPLGKMLLAYEKHFTAMLLLCQASGRVKSKHGGMFLEAPR